MKRVDEKPINKKMELSYGYFTSQKIFDKAWDNFPMYKRLHIVARYIGSGNKYREVILDPADILGVMPWMSPNSNKPYGYVITEDNQYYCAIEYDLLKLMVKNIRTVNERFMIFN